MEPLVGTPIDEVIGSNLRRLRRREGGPDSEVPNLPKLSQATVGMALTELTGVSWSQQTMVRAEKGKRRFTVVDLFAIAHIFGVSPIRLLMPWKPSDEKRQQREHPWVDAVRIGNLRFWPDEVIREFIVAPRENDKDAGKWQMKDGWPDPAGEPLREWLDLLGEGVADIKAAGGAFETDAEHDERLVREWQQDQRDYKSGRKRHN